jgi:hypothetical protein
MARLLHTENSRNSEGRRVEETDRHKGVMIEKHGRCKE